MYAVIRETTFDPQQAEQRRMLRAEFTRILAEQPGYRGIVAIDAGEGRQVTVSLWETEAQQQAAAAVLTPVVERLLSSTWTAPGRVIASGPVTYDDILRA